MIGAAVDLWMVYSFVRRLVTPFKEWEAYKLGIIDERGNVLKNRKELRRQEEVRAFGVFDVMILNLKKLLEKLPAGQTRLASYAAALWLIREHKAFTPESMLTEDISDQQLLESAESFFSSYTDYTILNENVNNKMSIDELVEERFQLDELFDAPYLHKIKYIKDDFGAPMARAKVMLSDETQLEVIFRIQNPEKDIWELFFRRGNRVDITSYGDQYKVFSTVISIAAKCIKKYNPKVVTFIAEKSSKSSSRSKLYDRMVSKFASSAGYNADMKNSSDGREYLLTRKINEDAPTNNVGSGAIAGMGVGPDGEPGVTRAQQKHHQKRTTKGKKLRDIIGVVP
jgi:hypothetical protein